MDGSRKFERLSKKGRQVSWSEHHWIRCTDIESAMEYEDNLEPAARYVSDVEATQPKPRGRTQPRRMGKEAREVQRELHELQRWTKRGNG